MATPRLSSTADTIPRVSYEEDIFIYGLSQNWKQNSKPSSMSSLLLDVKISIDLTYYKNAKHGKIKR